MLACSTGKNALTALAVQLGYMYTKFGRGELVVAIRSQRLAFIFCLRITVDDETECREAAVELVDRKSLCVCPAL